METKVLEWYDSFTDTKERKIFTYNEHKIPGLRMFGYHNTAHAIPALKPHYHKDCFEITFLKKGNIRFSVNDENYDLTGGDLYITFPNEVHGSDYQPLSIHEMYWFQIDVSDINNFLYTKPEVAKAIIKNLYNLPERVIKIKNSAAKNLPLIFDNIVSGTELKKIQTAYLIGDILCQIVNDSCSKGLQITPDIEDSINYINEHILEKIQIEDLAKISLLSVSRYKQKFKSQVGTGPRNYISFHKIELAKKMLEKNYNITDTAMELNFSNSNYFSTVFKRYTMLSPTEYVEQLKNKKLHHNATKIK